MSQWVYVQNRVVPEAEAVVSVFDHGFLYGDGIFTTMRAYQGVVFAFEEHMERLRSNAAALELAVPWTDGQLAEAIAMVLAQNQLSEAYLRLSISRGKGPIGIDPRLCPEPTLVIMAKPPAAATAMQQQAGVAIGVVETRRNPIESLDPALKSMNFLNNILAKLELNKQGYGEGVLLSTQGFVTEGTVSNLFWCKAGVLYTPAVSVGILAGITRAKVMEAAQRNKLPVVEGEFTLEQMLAADEVFLTNSGGELTPVIEIAGRIIGSGTVGSTTRLLQREFSKLVDRYTQTKKMHK